LAGAQSVQPGAVEQECAHVVPPTAESAIDKTHMPINGAVFDSIQAKVLQPCTTDAYAFKHTAVCTEFAVPPDHPFSVDSSPPCDSHVRVRHAAVNVTLYCHVRNTRALRRRLSTTAYAGPQADHWLTNVLLNTLPLRVLYPVPLQHNRGCWLGRRPTIHLCWVFS
jgi:hypothetical protein